MPRFSTNLWLLLAQNLAAFLGIAVQALILNLYLVALGHREDFLGLVAFVQTAAIGGGALPASWLAARIGARRCLILATLLLGAAFAEMAVFPDELLILAGSVVSGVSMALVFVPSAPFLMENARPEERSSAFAANFAALSIASVAGSALGGVLPGLVAGDLSGGAMQAVEGYRAALVVGALLTTLGVLPLLLADDNRVSSASTPTAPSSVPRRQQLSVARDLAAMGVATALLAGSTGMVVQFFNVYLRDEVQAPTETVGLVFAVASLLMAPMSLLGPRMASRWGAVAVVNLSRLLCVPLLLALALTSPGVVMSSAVYAVRSGIMGISQPIDNAFVMELVSPRQRAQVAAIRTISWNGGWAFTTGLGGLAIVQIGYPPIFAAAAALMLCSVAVHWFSFRGR